MKNIGVKVLIVLQLRERMMVMSFYAGDCCVELCVDVRMLEKEEKKTHTPASRHLVSHSTGGEVVFIIVAVPSVAKVRRL